MNSQDVTAIAGKQSVFDLFHEAARRYPLDIAIADTSGDMTYAEVNQRVLRLASVLQDQGIGQGDRIAILAENRREYLEVQLAAACIGAIVACQNWRLAVPELTHCLTLVEPSLIVLSEPFADALGATGVECPTLTFGAPYEAAINAAPALVHPSQIEPESGLVILYTSGTTGLPKGALISHRAQIARMCVYRMDLGVSREDGFCAWPPMFHMASTDQSLATLMMGGRVDVIDGFLVPEIVDVMSKRRLGWMPLMPGTVEPVIAYLKSNPTTVQGIRGIGAMLDMIPLAQAAEVSALTNAPFLNSFGSTETGTPPVSGRKIAPGEIPQSLSKLPNSLCSLRLLDEGGDEVPDGTPGEMAVRGPTLFSGYWNAPETNAKDFKDGWFRMGDLFCKNADGSYDFVDRSKYMIKSGGENIYPAEIERVLLSDPRIREAAVVKMPDPHWGEIPVAFIATDDADLNVEDVDQLCRAQLAGYKRPKQVRFRAIEDFPRSTTGKIVRHTLEEELQAGMTSEG